MVDDLAQITRDQLLAFDSHFRAQASRTAKRPSAQACKRASMQAHKLDK
jgi:hypothetical protein